MSTLKPARSAQEAISRAGPTGQIDADQIAEGLRDLAAAIREGTETFRPAAETVHSFGQRLDQLCRWLRGVWPWLLGLGLYAVQQAAPELYEAVKAGLSSVAQGGG